MAPRETKPQTRIGFDDAPAIDAFGRLRVGLPSLRLSALLDNGLRPLHWSQTLTGTATCVHLPNEWSALATVNASGDKVVRETRQSFIYRAGQSQLAFVTFSFGTLTENIRQRAGIYTDDNGFFFEAAGEAVRMVLRSYVTGAAVDEVVEQAEWNIDRLDGNGPSGMKLRPWDCQIFVVDYQWLGIGRVRVGFDIDGVVVPVHQFRHANFRDTVYMPNPRFPVRYELEATGAIGTAATMRMICAAVIREGGDDEPAVERVVYGPATPVAVPNGVWTAVLGVRIDPTAGANTTALLRLAASGCLCTDANDPLEWVIAINPVHAGSPAWIGLNQQDAITQQSNTAGAVTVDGNGNIQADVVLPGGAAAAASAGRGGVGSAESLGDLRGLFSGEEAWLVARGLGGASAGVFRITVDEQR